MKERGEKTGLKRHLGCAVLIALLLGLGLLLIKHLAEPAPVFDGVDVHGWKEKLRSANREDVDDAMWRLLRGGQKAIPVLLALIPTTQLESSSGTPPEETAGRRAGIVLLEMGPMAEPHLRRAADSKVRALRLAATELLEEYEAESPPAVGAGGRSSVEEMLDRIERRSGFDSDVICRLLDAIAARGSASEESIPRLERLAKDARYSVRSRAERALEAIRAGE